MKVILFSILFIWVWPAQADDLIEGNTIVPLQKQNVRLLSEEVRISSDSKITASFILENLSNSAFAMKVGFPFRAPGPKNIEVMVQEQAVAVKKQSMGGKGEIVIKDQHSGFSYEMYVWDISFAPKQKKTVRLEYLGQWGDTLAEETAMYFIYGTKTGALWTGNIAKADFYININEYATKLLNNKKNNFKLIALPHNYKTIGNQLEWHFVNWEPIGNISIAVMEETSELKNIFSNIIKHSEDILVVDPDK
jgi:hypothetical protein